MLQDLDGNILLKGSQLGDMGENSYVKDYYEFTVTFD